MVSIAIATCSADSALFRWSGSSHALLLVSQFKSSSESRLWSLKEEINIAMPAKVENAVQRTTTNVENLRGKEGSAKLRPVPRTSLG